MKKEVSTKKLVETIIEGIQNRKGQRIVTVDLRKLKEAPAEYFVIAEGGGIVIDPELKLKGIAYEGHTLE